MELRKLKKIVTIGSLVLSVPIILVYPPYILFGVDILKPTGIWGVFRGSDDLLVFGMVAPFIILSLSVPLYFTRKSIYFTWLLWTVVNLALFVIGVLYNNPRSIGSEMLYPIIAMLYTAGSGILLLINFILHIRDKRRMKST